MPHRGTCHHYDTRRNGREPRTGILQAAARRIGLAAAWLLAVSAATEEATFRPDIFSAELTGRTSIDLNGAWRFLRDPDNTGADQGWQHGKAESEGTMTVPGAPQAQGYGDAHPHQRTHFAEPFWIWRTFEVPQFAAREHVWFRLAGRGARFPTDLHRPVRRPE